MFDIHITQLALTCIPTINIIKIERFQISEKLSLLLNIVCKNCSLKLEILYLIHLKSRFNN